MRHIREKRSGQVGKTVNTDVTLVKGENPPADNALPRHQKVAERGKDFRKSKVPRHSPVSLSTTIVSAWHLSYKLATKQARGMNFQTTNVLYLLPIGYMLRNYYFRVSTCSVVMSVAAVI